MSRLLISFYNWSSENRTRFFTAFLLLVGLLGFLATRLQLEEDITRIIPKDEEVEKLNFIFSNSRFKEKLIIHVALKGEGDENDLANYAEAFSDSLQQHYGELIAEITSFNDEGFNDLYGTFYEYLPIFLDSQDYKIIAERITSASVHASVKAKYRSLISPTGFAVKEYALKDPLSLTNIVLDRLQFLQLDNSFTVYKGHVLTADKQHLLLFVSPANKANETARNGLLIDGLDKTIASLVSDHPKVSAEYFGGAAVAVGNANRIKSDITLSLSLASVLLILLVVLFYRRVSYLLIIFLPAAFGGLAALAGLYVIKGQVSAVALGIGSIVLGITVDYALHILTHFKRKQNVAIVIDDLTDSIITSCLTTAAAFLCLSFMSSDALKDLGLFAALSILNAGLFSLIVLPHFLKPRPQQRERITLLERLAAIEFDRKPIIVGAVILLTIGFIFFSRDVVFESDLSAMNYVPEHLAEAEKNLDEINRYKLKSMFLVASGDNMEEALRVAESSESKVSRLKEEGLVEKTAGPLGLLISDSLQEERIKQWKAFWTPQKIDLLKSNMDTASATVGFKPDAFKPFLTFLESGFEHLPEAKREELIQTFLSDYVTRSEDLTTVVTMLKVEDANKPKVYEAIGKSPDLLLLDRQLLTGKFMQILKDDFNLLIILSTLLVLLILMHTLGRVELGLITFLPIIMSWLWTIGIMGVFDIEFNMFNMIVSTFIFGLGIDYSIFISKGFVQEYKYGVKNTSSYKTSILLSAFTTVIGIGVLIFAKHPALQTIAIASMIGLASVLVNVFTIQPMILRWVLLNRKKKKEYPITIVVLLHTFLIWSFLLFMTLLVILSGLIIYSLLFIPMKRRKIIFHKVFQWICAAYIHVTFRQNYTLINETDEDFSKPAVVVCNHQSLIETPMVLMQGAKMIILTNDWVRKTPHFGPIAHLADFYSPSDGIDALLPKLKEKVEDGYSIIVFPEGTRAYDFEIGRFHKGAFYIAEQLQLDIVPFLFRGTGHFLRKNSITGRINPLTVKILPRINPDDKTFGENYSRRTKAIKNYMVEEYAALRHEIETPRYYRNKLLSNFHYKGWIEWYMKVKLRLEDDYKFYDDLLPKNGAITDLGCGYGFLVFMLSFRSKARELTGVDYDADKILAANNCFSKMDKITFITSDLLSYNYQPQDAFVLNDVLHYMPTESQQAVVRKCADNLNKGGVIVLRDGNAEMKTKHWGTRLTEFISTRFFNRADHDLEFIKVSEMTAFAESLGLEVEIVDKTKYTSNVTMVLRKRKA